MAVEKTRLSESGEEESLKERGSGSLRWFFEGSFPASEELVIGVSATLYKWRVLCVPVHQVEMFTSKGFFFFFCDDSIFLMS